MMLTNDRMLHKPNRKTHVKLLEVLLTHMKHLNIIGDFMVTIKELYVLMELLLGIWHSTG